MISPRRPTDRVNTETPIRRTGKYRFHVEGIVVRLRGAIPVLDAMIGANWMQQGTRSGGSYERRGEFALTGSLKLRTGSRARHDRTGDTPASPPWRGRGMRRC